MQNQFRPARRGVACLLVTTLTLAIPGCRQSVSAESLFIDSIAQKNHVADLISNGAPLSDVECARAKLDELQSKLDEKQKNISKVRWNKLWFKYKKRNEAASDRLSSASGAAEKTESEGLKEKETNQ